MAEPAWAVLLSVQSSTMETSEAAEWVGGVAA